MYDLHLDLYKFYDQHVRLSTSVRSDLLEYADINTARLERGLTKLGYPLFARVVMQGSVPMKTTVQHEENNYDIDVAVIFDADDLPSSALEARKRVGEAMCTDGAEFAKPPEVRTNAVTVWYKEGHHVDMAIHRRSVDVDGTQFLEHAGTAWTGRDPEKITHWFNNLVVQASPSTLDGATVKPDQMRRVVQLLKMSARLSGDDLPGGLIISTLVAEQYALDWYNDAVALHKTMQNIHSRLCVDTNVNNPVDRTYSLTYNDKYRRQVERLRDHLQEALGYLAVTTLSTCNRHDALNAWSKVFPGHAYWIDSIAAEVVAAEALGTEIQSAFLSGNLGVGAQGMLSTNASAYQATRIPNHRFYGHK